MAVFQFRGIIGATGKDVAGVREADNVKNLRAALRRDGILLTHAAESRAQEQKKSRDLQILAYFRRPSVSDVAVLTRQLATLVRAGIPLTEAISAMTEQVENAEMQRILASLREQVNQGVAFATALAEHPTVFPSLYINMVAAGEASGTLETVLERLASYMDSQAKLRGKVSAALAYPMLMLIIGSILISVLMIGVVPKVTAIFATLERALPWYTNVLIFVSNSFVSPVAHAIVCGLCIGCGGYLLARPPQAPIRPGVPVPKVSSSMPITVLSVGSVVFLFELVLRDAPGTLLLSVLPGALGGALIGNFLAWLKTEAGRHARDSFYLVVPVFGRLLKMIAVARFARTLATLLASGVQLLNAMEIVRAVIGNAALERVVDDAAGAIREGQSIAEPLRRSGKFPPIVTHMISVGERSGQLEQMLEAVSDSYESAVELQITALTSILEPMTIVVMGGAVGFIAFAILMPLIQMNDFNQ